MTNDELYDYLKNDPESLQLVARIFIDYVIKLIEVQKIGGLDDFYDALNYAIYKINNPPSDSLSRLLNHAINDYALEHGTDKT